MILNSNLFISRRQTIEGNNVTLYNPINELQMPFLPTTVSFDVYASILIENPEKQYDARVSIEDRNGEEVLNIGGLMETSPTPNNKVLMQLNIVVDDTIIRKDGPYISKLLINHEEICSYRFYVHNNDVDGKEGK